METEISQLGVNASPRRAALLIRAIVRRDGAEAERLTRKHVEDALAAGIELEDVLPQ